MRWCMRAPPRGGGYECSLSVQTVAGTGTHRRGSGHDPPSSGLPQAQDQVERLVNRRLLARREPADSRVESLAAAPREKRRRRDEMGCVGTALAAAPRKPDD